MDLCECPRKELQITLFVLPAIELQGLVAELFLLPAGRELPGLGVVLVLQGRELQGESKIFVLSGIELGLGKLFVLPGRELRVIGILFEIPGKGLHGKCELFVLQGR